MTNFDRLIFLVRIIYDRNLYIKCKIERIPSFINPCMLYVIKITQNQSQIVYIYKLFNTVNTYKYKALSCASTDYTVDRKYKNAFYVLYFKVFINICM